MFREVVMSDKQAADDGPCCNTLLFGRTLQRMTALNVGPVCPFYTGYLGVETCMMIPSSASRFHFAILL